MSNAVGVILTPFRSAISAISGLFSDIHDYVYEFDELKAENEALRIRIAEMESNAREGEDALTENERLRKLLKLAERRRDMNFVLCDIISRSNSNWESGFTLSKGSEDGISIHDCVMTEDGKLVGQITELGANWAFVTTLIDSSCEIGAALPRAGVTAVAEGDFSLMKNNQLKLTYIPENAVILNGDAVLTSGVGGVYPSDLVIGTISEVKRDAEGMGDYALIIPSVQLDKLNQLFVVTDFYISK